MRISKLLARLAGSRDAHKAIARALGLGGDGDAAATVAHAGKGGDGKEEEDADAPAALPHAVVLVGAPSAYSCGGAKKRKGCDGNEAAKFAHAVAPVGAPSAAAADAELRRFRKDQVLGFMLIIARAEFQDRRSEHEHAAEIHPN
jgi:hypothetical protein